MAKHCETFEHTADIGLAGRADTLGELFEALAEGLADLIVPRYNVSATKTRDFYVEAEDVEALAVDFLTEIINIIQTDRFAISAVRVGEACRTAIRAKLSGEALDLTRHELDREVKAVTYHQLEIAHDPAGNVWRGRVILDI